PGTGDVTGTVTFQGKNIASGTVIIVASDSLPYSGIVDEEGIFLVSKVPTGRAKIAVVSPNPEAGTDMTRLLFQRNIFRKDLPKSAAPPPPRVNPKKWFPLPDKYGDFKESGLTVTITGGLNWRHIPLD